MSTTLIYAVIDTESEGFVGKERANACAWCVRALMDGGTWKAERAHEYIPNAEECMTHYAKGTFSTYWGCLDRLNKEHKRTFTKFAVGYLARQRALEGKPIFMAKDAGTWRFCCGSGKGAAALDVANPAHVNEVLRVFFNAELVSCGIVLCAFDPLGRTMKVLEEDYAVYRPSAEHKLSVAARAVHGLDEATLCGGRDVSELHVRLTDIIERHPNVVFAAHYAQHDWSILLESIDNRLITKLIESRASGSDDTETTRLLGLRRELRNPSRWTCTWQRCVRQDSRVGIDRLSNYRLPTVYEAVTETPLNGHHNARTDAYACAVILCRLLGCNDEAVKRGFCSASSSVSE
jgi:DNA polymerase III epsilon subunit-like protein